jgi:hypothetical protein
VEALDIDSTAPDPNRRTIRPTRRHFLRAALGLGAATIVAGRAPLAWAEPIEYLWVATKKATPLRLDPEGHDLRWLPKGILLRVNLNAKGPRLWAWCPAFARFGSVDAVAVEDAPAPDEQQLLAQRVVPVTPSSEWVGELPARTIGSANVRTWPEGRPDTMAGTLGHNTAVRVVEKVVGEDGEDWYRVADSVAGPNAPRGVSFFIHTNSVRAPRQEFHPTTPNPDRLPPRWIEGDLLVPTLLTAYESGRAVWASLALYGRQPNLTPSGEHKVLYRVARETMTSERVTPPIPRDAPGGYYLENVLYTQYFSTTGAAIHYNYWSSNWGYPGSHGCLGLPLNEAKWVWDWSAIGTPVLIFG